MDFVGQLVAEFRILQLGASERLIPARPLGRLDVQEEVISSRLDGVDSILTASASPLDTS